MCPIYTDQEEGNGVSNTLHTQTNTHTHTRMRDVGLLRNTGIDPLSPPLDNSKSCQTSILPSASETPGPLPLKQQSGSAYAIILILQFVNGCSLFQRQLSIINFTLNFPPIRDNLTSASLLSMLIETDYLNYPLIRNNLSSASLPLSCAGAILKILNSI